MIIECYGICSENCLAMINGKCSLEAEKEKRKGTIEIENLMNERDIYDY